MTSIVHVEQQRKQMATDFSFVVSVPSSEAGRASRALDRAHAVVAELEAVLSEFRPDSPVARLNRSAAFERVIFDAPSFALLQLSERLWVRTQGAFDPLAKSTRHPVVRLEWDENTREVWRTDVGTHLSFGAIGKGYALDVVRAELERDGFTDFLLSAGGSSQVFRGFSAPGTPWTWGWSWGRDADGDSVGIPFQHANGHAIAIGVSGTEEQGAHLIRPDGQKTYPCRSSFAAHGSAAVADALSTALFVAGWEESMGAFSAEPEALALAAIDLEGCPRWNGVFQSWWGAIPSVLLASSLLIAPDGRAEGPSSEEAVDLSGMSGTEEAVDLGDGASQAAIVSAKPLFFPYDVTRDPVWMIPAVFMIAMVLLHLKKTIPGQRPRPKSATPRTGSKIRLWAGRRPHE